MDGQEYNGLTLEGLAQRLEALERENAELQDEVAALRGSGTGPAEEEFAPRFEGPLSSTQPERTARRGPDTAQQASMQPELAARRYSDTGRRGEPAAEFAGQASSSRWSLLRNAGAAALGSMVAGAVTQRDIREAKATDIFGPLLRNAGAAALGVVAAEGLTQRDIREARTIDLFGDVGCLYLDAGWRDGWPAITAHNSTTQFYVPTVYCQNFGSGPGVVATSHGRGPGVEGTASGDSSKGVMGTGSLGVWGQLGNTPTPEDGAGVRGDGGGGGTGVWGATRRHGFSGVYGQHIGSFFDTNGYGVLGDGRGSLYAGVLGRNPSGFGVRGKGQMGGVEGTGETGVTGRTNARGGAGVRGEGSSAGNGVVGRSLRTGYIGVRGQNVVKGYGVVGDGKGAGYAGVLGRNPSGYGGTFQGGQAQLRLMPGSEAGEPTGRHEKGEIYLDSEATLWVCEESGGDPDGDPATWRAI